MKIGDMNIGEKHKKSQASYIKRASKVGTVENPVESPIEAALLAAEQTKERLKDAVDKKTGRQAVEISLALLEDAPHNWNDAYSDIRNQAELFEKMKASISVKGIIEPITVWEKKDKSGYHILSGHSRKRVYEYFYKEKGLEEFKEIHAFIYPYDALTETEAIGILTDANIKRIDTDEATKILETALLIKAFKEEAERIFYQNRGKYERESDIIGEMLNLNGKTIDNYRTLAKMGRDVLELLNTTPLRRTHLLNPIIKNNKQLQEKLVKNRDFINQDVTRAIVNGREEDLVLALEGKLVKEELSTITLKLPEAFAESISIEIEQLMNTYGVSKDKYSIKTKKAKVTPHKNYKK